MRRVGNVWQQVISLENLWGAWKDFRRGKRQRPSVRRFEFEADQEIVRLRDDLAEGAYQPSRYRLLMLREPKVRLIAAAAVRDRVVHHAVHRVLSPILDRSFIDTTYACLPGRGSHRAVICFLGALRRYSYVLLLDIRHYFLAIDRTLLLQLMERKLKDRRILELLRIIAQSGDGIYSYPGVAAQLGLPPGFPPHGCGLPIGNLTSQWWGNHYLSGLDHFIKRNLKVPQYHRYMDDLALFGNSRQMLKLAREEVALWLAAKRHLALKHPDASVRSTNQRFRYLGYRVSRPGIDPTSEVLIRMRRRLRSLVLAGQADKLYRSLASYKGLLGFSSSNFVNTDLSDRASK